jgi:ubiquinone/menaquinone biosynthesis C-methylase UbiE
LTFTVKVITRASDDQNVESMSSKSTNQSDAVLREWRKSAVYLKKHSGTIHTMLNPVTQALIEEAEIVAGQSVLDVAGGAGEPSLTIAEMVGPTGSVTCTDAVAEMVVTAQNGGQRRGLTNVLFRQCSADSLPFESESFDAAVSRLGAMFFPDPPAAIREMLRVTFWEMRSETSEILREKLATLSPPQAELLAREAQEAVRGFFRTSR